jgi:uncharacterized membrane protein YedE/YeeE
MSAFTAFLAGLVFGIGLLVSGMANPAKVLGFLDIAGRWDPSLLLVMAGAIPVAAVAYRVAAARTATFLGGTIDVPTRREIDFRLAAGAAIFGIGWGLAGLCPAPAIVAVGAGRAQGAVFTVAMLAGMTVFAIVDALRTHAAPAAVAGDA